VTSPTIPSRPSSALAVRKLIAQAQEADWSRRRDAGLALAPCADQADAAAALLDLLLDPDDTAVTEAVAWGLLRYGGEAGVTLIARAAAGAAPDTVTWLAAPVAEYVDDFGSTGLVAGITRLTASRDRELAAGAAEVLGWIEHSLIEQS
jgi:hypothetical protein